MSHERSTANLGALIVSAVLVMVGIVALVDIQSYSDIDSKVFPQAVAWLLIFASVLSFVTSFLKPEGDGTLAPGVWWRRILLVISMLLACAVMPYSGFLPAAAVAFVGGLIAAMHDRWSARTLVLYWSVGAMIIATFFSLFKFLLYVPLP